MAPFLPGVGTTPGVSNQVILKGFYEAERVSREGLVILEGQDSAWLPFGSDLLALFPTFRRYIYPVMKQPFVFGLLATKIARVAFRTAFQILSSVGGRSGNSLIVVARKG